MKTDGYLNNKNIQYWKDKDHEEIVEKSSLKFCGWNNRVDGYQWIDSMSNSIITWTIETKSGYSLNPSVL